jgi:hypothetical protein
MKEPQKMHKVLEQLFGGDVAAGTFKTVVWLSAVVVLVDLVRACFGS